MNVLLTVILFVDFVYRLLTAPSRSGYFFRLFGWADLLSSLPFPQLKILRLFRLVRVSRLMRARGGRLIGHRLLRNRAGSALLSLLLMGILVLEFGSLWMLAHRAGRPGRQHHHGLGLPLVRRRDDLDRRLRRPVPGDERGPRCSAR